MAAAGIAPTARADAIVPPGVGYRIDVTLDTRRHHLDGWATVGYRSGADSTLHALWLHAYPNAFSSHETVYGREGEKYGEDYSLRLAAPRDRGWMTLDSASVNGMPARIDTQETLARLDLPEPLAPGDSVTFRVHFRVGIPRVFDRFGRTGQRYSIAQWYPKMVVYDARGWARDPYHYFSEFYGEFGTYDVALTLPDEMWVGATGVLTGAVGGDNEIPPEIAPRDSVSVRVRVVGADSLAGLWPREALRLEPLLGAASRVPRDSSVVWRVPARTTVHYRYVWSDSAGIPERLERDEGGRRGPVRSLCVVADTALTDTLRALAAPKPGADGERRRAAGDATPDSSMGSLKTLHFHAERVHDFAFVAAPDYVRADTTWNGTRIRSLIYREDSVKWHASLVYTVEAFRHFSDLVGPYIWPQFTCAEAFTAGGAMEYPMLIMNDPDLTNGEIDYLDATIAHELGHNWFYGMLANDERRHPWLDEGFAQFLEQHYTDRRYPRGVWKLRDRFPWAAPMRAYQGDEIYLLDAHYQRDEVPPAWAANECRGYRQYAIMAYDRPATMLRTLEGVVGEEKYRAFLHELYRRRVGRHVEPEVVTESARAATGLDLDRYFAQWIGTTDVPDFALGGIRREKTATGNRATVTVLRKGGIDFPVPVEARYADGTSETRWVATPAARNEVVFEHASPVEKVALDPRHEIFDANRLNDQGGLVPPMRVRPFVDVATTDAMSVIVGPTAWYGVAEGARLGAWVDGRYLPGPEYPLGLRSFEAGLNVGTHDGSVAWRVGAARRAGGIGARAALRALAAKDAGLLRAELTLSNRIGAPGRRHPWRSWSVTAQYLDRDADETFGGAQDRVDPNYWSAGRTMNVGASLGLRTQGPRRRESFTFEGWHGFDADGAGADDPGASYDRVSLEAKQNLDLGARGNAHVGIRLYGGLASDDAPLERRFDAVQATRLETLDRFYANDRGPLRETDRYNTGGGGGVRGYLGEVALGTGIAAAGLEFRHDRWPLVLFADTARLRTGAGSDAALSDAGLGVAWRNVRLDFPVWLSKPPADENPFEMRWVFSFDLPELRWR